MKKRNWANKNNCGNRSGRLYARLEKKSGALYNTNNKGAQHSKHTRDDSGSYSLVAYTVFSVKGERCQMIKRQSCLLFYFLFSLLCFFSSRLIANAPENEIKKMKKDQRRARKLLLLAWQMCCAMRPLRERTG
jgi:hypothetical protein